MINALVNRFGEEKATEISDGIKYLTNVIDDAEKIMQYRCWYSYNQFGCERGITINFVTENKTHVVIKIEDAVDKRDFKKPDPDGYREPSKPSE